jgi:hypothetical protein
LGLLQHYRHKDEVPDASSNVRLREQSRRHLLARVFRILAAHRVISAVAQQLHCWRK